MRASQPDSAGKLPSAPPIQLSPAEALKQLGNAALKVDKLQEVTLRILEVYMCSSRFGESLCYGKIATTFSEFFSMFCS